MKSKVDAKLKIFPRGSQQLVVIFGVVCALGALASIWFITFDKPYIWLLPFAIFGMSGGAAVWCWRHSHLSADMPEASRFSVTKPDGTNVAADSRLFSNPDSAKTLAQVINMVAERAELPPPDGLVLADGSPDASRIAQAQASVDSANNQSRQIATEFADGMAIIGRRAVADQPSALDIEFNSSTVINQGTATIVESQDTASGSVDTK